MIGNFGVLLFCIFLFSVAALLTTGFFFSRTEFLKDVKSLLLYCATTAFGIIALMAGFMSQRLTEQDIDHSKNLVAAIAQIDVALDVIDSAAKSDPVATFPGFSDVTKICTPMLVACESPPKPMVSSGFKIADLQAFNAFLGVTIDEVQISEVERVLNNPSTLLHSKRETVQDIHAALSGVKYDWKNMRNQIQDAKVWKEEFSKRLATYTEPRTAKTDFLELVQPRDREPIHAACCAAGIAKLLYESAIDWYKNARAKICQLRREVVESVPIHRSEAFGVLRLFSVFPAGNSAQIASWRLAGPACRSK